MDQQKRRQIKEAIFQACSNQQQQKDNEDIEPKLLNQIKKLCKQSDENVACAFEQLWHQLKHKKSSQVRYYALLITDELFKRSSKFRTLLCEHFQEFIAYVVTGNDDSANESKRTKQSKVDSSVTPNPTKLVVYELPPPRKYANLLRDRALVCIELWEEKYGTMYRSLKIGYQFLKKVLQVRMPNIREQRELMQQRQQERDENTRKLALLKYERVKNEYMQNMVALGICLKQMDICVKIIVPDFEDMFGLAINNHQPQPTSNSSSSSNNNNSNDHTSGSSDNSNVQNQSTSNTIESGANDDDWEDVDLDATHGSSGGGGGSSEDDVALGSLPDSGTFNNDEEEQPYQYLMGEAEDQYDGDDMVGVDTDNLINEGYDDLNDFILGAGLGSSDYEITIENSFDNLKNADNSAAYDILREGLAELQNRWLPMVKDWLSVLTSVQLADDSPQQEKQKYEQILRIVIEMKEQIKQHIKKCEDLQVRYNSNNKRKRSQKSIWDVPELAVEELNLNQSKKKRAIIAVSNSRSSIQPVQKKRKI